MNNVDRCLICGEIIPEGAQVCKGCMAKYSIETKTQTEVVESIFDIENILSITDGTDRNIKKSTESILRIADRLEKKKHEKRDTTKILTQSSTGKAAYSKKP